MLRKFLAYPIDWLVLVIPILLTGVGVITIYTVTYNGNGNSLMINQLEFAVLGLIGLALAMFSNYKIWRSLSMILFVVGIFLLLPLLPFWAAKLPFVLKVYGAHRWLNLGFFELQPAEIFKLFAAVFAADFWADRIGKARWQFVVIYLVLAIASFGLILLQPDLGTAVVVLMIFVGVFLASKPPIRLVLAILAVVLISLPIAWTQLKPYQKERISVFINPSDDPEGANYNVNQSLIAVGSGGLFGRGFGQGSQTVLSFLPVAQADFIFAGYAEATGFVGSAILVLLYGVLIYRAIVIAQTSSDDAFGELLAIAIACKFTFQAVVHIAMNLGLLPVTGIPLPFMSYGGTALVIDLICVGILESIYIRNKKGFFG
jgi:rod shape determining protein RodA